MLEIEIENLKELVYELEEEIENGNNEEAAVTIDFIYGVCSSLLTKLKE